MCAGGEGLPVRLDRSLAARGFLVHGPPRRAVLEGAGSKDAVSIGDSANSRTDRGPGDPRRQSLCPAVVVARSGREIGWLGVPALRAMPPRIGNTQVPGSTRDPEGLGLGFCRRGEFRTEFGHQFPGCAAVSTQPGEMLPAQRLQALEAGVAEQAIAAWRGQVGTSLSYLQPQGSQLGELSFIARPDLDKSIGDEEDRTR